MEQKDHSFFRSELRLHGKSSDVITTNGDTYTGEVISLDDDGYITLLQDDGTLIVIPKGSLKVILVKEYGKRKN